ncbi:M56 family metallopeptidase [Bacteroidota bacterium]
MTFINTLLGDPLTQALGWTIIHSLWQGLGIGFIVFLILKIRKDGTPQFKYLTGIFALVAILTSSLITFLFEFQPIHGLDLTASIPHIEKAGQTPFGILAGETGREIWNIRFQAIQQSISTSFNWMTSLWFIGVLIISFRLAGGMILINRMRSREVYSLPVPWEKRLEILARKAGIRRALQFVQSTRVKVPTVIGILRPMILIPAGIISLMPMDQLESILAHEIAHIRRYDFLVNIFQSLIEALFFYHPVVWIISEKVRQEREKCCDDVAVALCGKLSTYARALAGLSELQVRSVLPSVALTGNKNRIINRVERLIKTKKMKTNASEKIVAGLVILGSAIIVTLSTGAGKGPMESNTGGSSVQIDLMAFENNKAETSEDLEPAIPAEPSMPGLPDTTHIHHHINMDVKDNVVIREFVNKDGEEQSLKFVIRKGEVEELYVNGEAVPKSEFPEYEKEIDRTMSDLDDMDQDLRKARHELGELDLEEIRMEVEADMEHFRQHEMLEFQEQLKKMQEESLNMQLDEKKMQEEIEKAMKEATKAIENIEHYDMTEIQELINEQMLSLEKIDYDKMQEDLKNTIKEIEPLDFAEIERHMQESIQHLEHERFNIDKEKEKINEMIDEIEKLELENR